ncbi:MAG: hypothetical protein KAW87_02170, partial [Candidatus Cloacimonetes bacterium]|nr:hypothetical protein [Candidatus Cloacimonadota bacterium]
SLKFRRINSAEIKQANQIKKGQEGIHSYPFLNLAQLPIDNCQLPTANCLQPTAYCQLILYGKIN